MSGSSSRARESGATLIELVIAIIVVSICITAVLGLLTSISTGSVAPMIRAQSTSIATAYLERILAEPFGNVNGYNGLTHVGARNLNNAAVAGLNQYTVRVDVFGATLGNAPNDVPALRVRVTVTDPTGGTTSVSGYRTNHAGQILY